jgi:TetR/AcrR family transcriptional regulator
MTSHAPGLREQRRQVHQELSRNQLLDAAEEVFGRKGYHETTLKEIAELADFSVGSVYSFFENKDDLFVNVWIRRGEQFTPEFETVLSATTDGLDALRRIVEFEVGFFRRYPNFARLYLRSSGTVLPSADGPTPGWVTSNANRVLEMQAAAIAAGQAEGLLREGDPAVLARVLTGMVQSFQAMDPEYLEGSRASPKLEDLQDMVCAAFSAAGPTD